MTARRIIVYATAIVLMAAGIASAQKTPKCSDIPITVTILAFDVTGDATNDSALSGDTKGTLTPSVL